MSDTRSELIDRILMSASGMGIPYDVFKQKLILIFENYEVTPAERGLIVFSEGKNPYFINRWLIAKTVAGCSPRTINYYRKVVTNILNEIGKDADTVDSVDIQIYFAKKKATKNSSNTTLDNERRCLSSFYDYLQREELVPKNPMSRVDKIKLEHKKEKVFTEYEIEIMRSQLASNREKAMFEILLSTGCRVSEMVSIKIDDLNGDKCNILGKGNKHRDIYFNAKAQIAIQKYLEERTDSNPYLFPRCVSVAEYKKREGVSQKFYAKSYLDPGFIEPDGEMGKGAVESIFRKLGKRCGIENVHPHRFRKTCATHALRKGMPLELVSKMLGHAQIATTQIYLDLSEDELEQAHKKYV